MGQGLTPENIDHIHEYSVIILFHEVPEKSKLQNIKKIVFHFEKGIEIHNHFISLYKYFSEKEIKLFKGDIGSKK